jgi:hypothetical protein
VKQYLQYQEDRKIRNIYIQVKKDHHILFEPCYEICK